MADKIAPNHKKIEFTPYDVGEGNHFVSYKGFDRYHAYGCIEGHNVQMEGKDLAEIESKLLNFLGESKRTDTINAMTCEGLELTLKENGLVKIVKEKDSGEKN